MSSLQFVMLQFQSSFPNTVQKTLGGTVNCNLLLLVEAVGIYTLGKRDVPVLESILLVKSTQQKKSQQYFDYSKTSLSTY